MANTITFDTAYYLSNNPDVAAAVSRGLIASAQAHYNEFGRFEGRDPNAFFDTSFYLSQNPDVVAAGVNPLDHFLNFGAREGRFANATADNAIDSNNNNFADEFDANAYLTANPDVASAVGAGRAFANAYQHFILFGQFENRAGTPTTGPFTNNGEAVGAGSTFVLTAGVDTITGTTANDTFNALTVNAAGTAATTLSAFDTINGGSGIDTLNIFSDGTSNTTLDASTKISNVEIININNSNTAFTTGTGIDASRFAGATNINQVGLAAAVTNLASTTTATFTNITSGGVSVAAATGATSAAVALSNFVEGQTVAVSGAALNTVKLTGSVIDGTDVNTTVDSQAVTVEAGVDVATVTINSSVAATLTISEAGTSTKNITTVDASGSTGAITYSADTATTTIRTGSAADTVTVSTTTAAAAGSTAAVNATVATGAGNDTITVSTTGTGATTIDAGAGNDTVNVTSRGSGVLSVNLGDGNDTFTSAVAINGTDVIDAGAGVDTLLLNLVGSANIGAFANFDVFDAAGLGKALDVDILASKNVVTEFVASADVGSTASLTNIGAGIGFRATGDLGTTNTLALTQKVAGELTVTVDADETGTADTAIDTAGASVNATNATSLKAVFDTSYLASITGETATGDNVTTLNLAGVATSLNIVSGGQNANNVLSYTDNGTSDTLTSVVISGDRAIDFSAVSATKLATVNASAQTGGLTFDLADLANTGTVTLGSGRDVITVTSASTAGAFETISGFEKTAAIAVSTTAADATARTAAIADADVLVLAGATVANANSGVATGTIANGVLTFTGTGPSTLDAAVVIASNAAETAGEAVAFQYGGDSYVFVQGTTDTVVRLAGVTGLTNFVENGTDNFFVV